MLQQATLHLDKYQARFEEVLHKEANMNCKETPSNWQKETKSDCNRIL